MSSLSLQQIMSSRFRTSLVADSQTKQLMESLGLSTKANVARLAIGRSLSLGPLSDDNVDAKGLEIPASSLFSQDDVAAWVGLIVTHARHHGDAIISTMDAFRALVRQHWHRGAHLLMEDWKDNHENFDSFVSTLVKRRAELPERSRPASSSAVNPAAVDVPDMSTQLSRALSDIGVSADVKGVIHGPRLSRYRVLLRDVNQLDKLRKGLERLALVLSLQNHIPALGHGDEAKTVTIDIPRPKSSWVQNGRGELMEALHAMPSDNDSLMVFPGVDVIGKPVSFNLANAPHLLVGGATGQGKSVCVHTLIVSLLSRHTPSTLRLALIDPKQVEFNAYAGSKFLWGDGVAVGVAAASTMIEELVTEMDDRYRQLNAIGVNNIAEAKRKGLQFPFIVACIDELADLVIQSRDLESKIVRLAQLARAAGIHLVLATQRPDAKTFSGLIRSNIPCRIALTVQKASESQIILDEVGAEDLLGSGDMLIKISGGEVVRAHGYYLSLSDVHHALQS
ncbi:FtsK/SpoIIIE domain-containing protein [Mesorhizobium sp.]|uniref:FtsK/SpoIIIE domain-containing protein n=1 Tax=Mesorhizobium sp. TaxID=1871066 RepID=UPI00121466F2|nr:FtsK/SpoIIIE domain-containing protein [Mesorhizobium sp.]TIM38448.1 MAG: DUF1832 domain-containing protein [Mesorhizobium sp.]